MVTPRLEAGSVQESLHGELGRLLGEEARPVPLAALTGERRGVGRAACLVTPAREFLVIESGVHVTKPTGRCRLELVEGDADLAAGRCGDAIEQALGVKANVEVVERGHFARSAYRQVRVVDA